MQAVRIIEALLDGRPINLIFDGLVYSRAPKRPEMVGAPTPNRAEE
jgi:hypothetical protein